MVSKITGVTMTLPINPKPTYILHVTFFYVLGKNNNVETTFKDNPETYVQEAGLHSIIGNIYHIFRQD